jgi:hypothetical protein
MTFHGVDPVVAFAVMFTLIVVLAAVLTARS